MRQFGILTEPVAGTDSALKNGQESKGHPVLNSRVSCLDTVTCVVGGAGFKYRGGVRTVSH